MSSTTSPLTLQMLLASGGGVQQDPAIAAALPRLQMAQALMQNGVSDAPTNKYGALSRVGQALLGNYTFDQAQGGIQDILKQRQTSSANALNSFFGNAPPGNPQGNAPAGTPIPTSATAPTSSVAAFADKLGSSEAPNPQAVNGQGFSGQFQFGAGRLASDGLYTPAQGEDLKGNQWKGTFNIPGFPTVKTQADFLGNPAAQHAALALDVANTDHAIGQTPGADQFDQNGLRAVAHLGGLDGMKQFVASGGKSDPNDSNGTKLSDYYQKFSTGGAPAPAPTGQNAPQTSQSLMMMRQAMAYGAANPYDPNAQRIAAQMMDYAKTLGTLDTYNVDPVTHIQTNNRTGQQTPAAAPLPHYVPSPTGSIDTTGTHPPTYEPAPRVFTTQTGATGAVGSGGGITPIEASPTGIGGTGAENVVMRTLAELGPRIVAGDPTLTAQERAAYNTAATTYQGFKTATLPDTGALGRVPEHPLPPGMPPPVATAAPSAPPPGTQEAPSIPHTGPSIAPPVTPAMPPQGTGNPDVTSLTGGSRGPAVAQAATQSQIDNDSKAISEDQATAMKGHSALGATAAIRAVMPQVMTGPTADGRLLLARYATTLGIPGDQAQALIGTNPVQGELLQKKLFEIQTHALRLMGAREPGSVLNQFQQNFPNMASQPGTVDAMTRMMDMDQTYGEDDARGRQQYLNQQIQNVGQNRPYAGMGGYQQLDPRVYVGAGLASGGLPFATWSKGLSPEQQAEALKITARLYPDASALDANGVKHQIQRALPAQGAGGG